MKRLFLLLICIPVIVTCFAQRTDITPQINIEGVLRKDYNSYEEGTPVKVMNVVKLKNRKHDDGVYLAVSIHNTQVPIPSNDARYLELHPKNMQEFWMAEYIKADMFGYYDNKGYNRSLRAEITEEANDYLQSLSDAFYDDDYIQDYIRTIFTGIVPTQLNNKRPETVDIEIIRSPNPDAYMLPNGVLILTTGMLSTLDSVEELTAIIASEMAHYVLDHQLVNTVKETNRVRRAEFWGDVLLAAAGITEVVLTESNENYVPGGIFLASGLTSAVINIAAISRLGLGYSAKQVRQADRVAQGFLEMAGMNKGALASALTKIKNFYVAEGDTYAFSSEGGYANIDKRLKSLDEVEQGNFANREFQKKMAGVNTINSMIQLNSKNYASAKRFAKLNIDNKFATDDDYAVYIKADMQLTNSPEANQKNLDLVRYAKSQCVVPNLTLYKQEILLLMRLEQEEEASKVIKQYIDLLVDYKKDVTDTAETQWASSEMNWANKLYKQINLF